MKKLMLLIGTAVILGLAAQRPALSADDAQSGTAVAPAPSAEAMVLDGLVYRPLTLAGTVIGTGIFLATLPFSWLGGNAGAAGNRLVVEPARTTFTRCLGCLEEYRGPAPR